MRIIHDAAQVFEAIISHKKVGKGFLLLYGLCCLKWRVRATPGWMGSASSASGRTGSRASRLPARIPKSIGASSSHTSERRRTVDPRDLAQHTIKSMQGVRTQKSAKRFFAAIPGSSCFCISTALSCVIGWSMNAKRARDQRPSMIVPSRHELSCIMKGYIDSSFLLVRASRPGGRAGAPP